MTNRNLLGRLAGLALASIFSAQKITGGDEDSSDDKSKRREIRNAALKMSSMMAPIKHNLIGPGTKTYIKRNTGNRRAQARKAMMSRRFDEGLPVPDEIYTRISLSRGRQLRKSMRRVRNARRSQEGVIVARAYDNYRIARDASDSDPEMVAELWKLYNFLQEKFDNDVPLETAA